MKKWSPNTVYPMNTVTNIFFTPVVASFQKNEGQQTLKIWMKCIVSKCKACLSWPLSYEKNGHMDPFVTTFLFVGKSMTTLIESPRTPKYSYHHCDLLLSLPLLLLLSHSFSTTSPSGEIIVIVIVIVVKNNKNYNRLEFVVFHE